MTLDTTILTMAGAATTAVLAACGFVINCAVKVGRHLQIIDDLASDAKDAREEADVLKETVAIIDKKVERHLQWHDDQPTMSEGNAE